MHLSVNFCSKALVRCTRISVHRIASLLVKTTLSKILLSCGKPELLYITFFSGYSTVYNIHLKDQMSITTETAHHISLQYHYTPYIIPQSFHMVSTDSVNWSQLCEYYIMLFKTDLLQMLETLQYSVAGL